MSNVFEVPPGPHVDSTSDLEHGEIVETTQLGGGGVSLVTLKGGNQALFYPAIDPIELVAFWIDSLLGFGLVPAITARPVNNQSGLLQRFISGARPALYYKTWEDMVQPAELLKAAVFDYILDSRDRKKENFLINETSRKLWLIENDYHMVLSSLNRRDILDTAVNRGLVDLPPDVLEAIDRFYASSPSLLEKSRGKEIIDVINRARERAKIILDKKIITKI